jgi:hypothetical protein
MLGELIKATREACEEALRRPQFLAVQCELAKCGISDEAARCMVLGTDESTQSQEGLRNLKTALPRVVSDGAFERYLIVQSALASIERIPDLPVPVPVKKLLCDEFRFFAHADDAAGPLFRVGEYRFSAMCKTASLRRFPAGQLDWEISGLPRSDVFRAPMKRMLRLLLFAANRLGGFRPLLNSHMANRRPTRFVLLESEMNRSYYQMAKAMKLQPAIKGLCTKAWFYSPDTYKISPHLSWTTRVFLENGGLVSTAGPAGAESGVFERSPERRKAFEAGTFQPTVGLVVWPRKEMIGWADQHPEFDHA